MRSIKRRRELLEKINSADKVNSNESRLLGYLVLTEDYPELLDWAERARAWLAVQLDAGDYTPSQYEDLKKLLEELPE